MTDDNIKVTLPLTVEDITATTDETFANKTIPYLKEWIGEELYRMRRDMKQAIRDHDEELGNPIARGE